MSQTTITDKEIKDSLRRLRKAAKLEKSNLASSCLVRRRLENNEVILSRAIRDALSDVLSVLEEENANYADLLRGRFWEDHKVDKMLADGRPFPIGRRRFFDLQKEAEKRFVSIFRQLEEACLANLQESGSVEMAQTPAMATLSIDDSEPASTPDIETAPPQSQTEAVTPSTHKQTLAPLSWLRSRPAFAVITFVILIGLLVIFIVNDSITAPPETALSPTQPPTEATLIATSSPPLSPTAASKSSSCGEETRLDIPPPLGPRFMHQQGVDAFRVDNTPDMILNNKVRSVGIDNTGLWIGYYDDNFGEDRNGITHFDRKTWAFCDHPAGPRGKNINDIAFDAQGQVWVAAEREGVSRFDGESWYTYTTADGLPSSDTFGITIDEQDHVWVATWNGVAKFDGKKWTTPYHVSNGTLSDDHVHEIAFDEAGNIWVGLINEGLNLLPAGSSEWVYHTTETVLGSNKVRRIAVLPATEERAESVWIATDEANDTRTEKGGGITKYEQGTWTIYNEENGLPDSSVQALAIDKYQRLWAGTGGGTAYFDGTKWITYNTLSTLDIAFGPACQDCPIDDEHVWTGTIENGATHSRLPYPEPGVDLIKACFQRTGQEATCHAPTEDSNDEVAIINYPEAVTAGEEIRLELQLAPRAPYELREDRGDFLRNLAPTEEEQYGTWLHMVVKGVIHSGEPFAFTDYEFPLKVPEVKSDEPQSFTSSWRVWMHTRYTGAEIRLIFTIEE